MTPDVVHLTKNVLLVENMKHNLLIVSQMCDQGHTLTFDSKKLKIRNKDTSRSAEMTSRTSNNVYILDEKYFVEWEK